MLDGFFKIGTHEGYSNGEAAGLLSDTSEGKGSTQIIGDLHNFNANIGTGRIRNCSAIGSKGPSFEIDHGINCNIFCCTNGSYNRKIHNELMFGTDNYSPNINLTSYIVLEKTKFMKALSLLGWRIFDKKCDWVGGEVIYGKRNTVFYSSDLPKIITQNLHFERMARAFTKPLIFSPENEWRFAMVPIAENRIPNDIFTSSFGSDIHDAFKATIYDMGCDNPTY